MSLLSNVRFSSGFPDDAVYDADEICEEQGGRNIAEALKTALERLNYRVSDLIDGGDHGWELDIWSGRQRLWLQVSVIDTDENYLAAEPFWLLPNMKVFRKFLEDLQQILEADHRFSRIGWFKTGASTQNITLARGPFEN